MTKFKVNILSSEEVTREPDPEDKWDRADTRQEHTIVDCEMRKGKEYGDFELEGDFKVGDVLFFVYALYNTGDTFGSDENLICEIALLKDYKDALHLKAALDEDAKDKDYSRSPLQITYPVSKISCPVCVSTWKGYFESLNSIEIASVIISK